MQPLHVNVDRDKSFLNVSVVEFLSDVFPCGINPVGVILMAEASESSQGEDFEFISKLIGQLPVISAFINYHIFKPSYNETVGLTGYFA